MKKLKVAVLLLASSLMTSTVFANGIDGYNKQINDLKNKVNQNEQQTDKLNGELSKVNKDMDVVQSKVDELDVKLKKTLVSIHGVEKQIASTESKINTTKSKIVKTEADLKLKKEVLAKNLRVLYSRGEVSMMEFLFSSKDLADFMDRFEQIKSVAKANKGLYDEVRTYHQVLQTQKKNLETQKTKQEQAKNELDGLQKIQKSQQIEQLGYLKQLDSQKHEIENDLDETKSAMSAIENQIAQVIAQREAEKKRIAAEQERKRKEEEERKKREQEQQNNNGGNNGGGNTNPTPQPEPQQPAPSTGKAMLPLPAGSYYISSYFGYRNDPITGEQKYHNGVDMAAPLGTPIYAINDGYVLYSGAASGYGNWIVIDHGDYYSIYGHMYDDELYVSAGQTVKRGQNIAAVGSNGRSTGAHLHISCAKGSLYNYFDPMSLF